MKNWEPPGIRAGIRHGDRSPVVPVTRGELILYHVTGSAATGTVRIAALDHESIDDTVEDNAIVETLFYQGLEIACCDGHVGSKGDNDGAHGGFKTGLSFLLLLSWYAVITLDLRLLLFCESGDKKILLCRNGHEREFTPEP